MDPTDAGNRAADAPRDPVQHDRPKPWWAWALAILTVIALGVAAAVLVWGGDDEGKAGTRPGTSTTTSTSTSATTPDTTTTSTTTTTQGGVVPGAVAGVRARPGGGSGEVAVNWEAVTGTSGYRVLRSDTASGPFETVADLDITTGETTAAPEATNIWSAQHSYLPSTGALATPDQSPSFEYVEVGGPGQRCFRVIAFNEAGDGPASAVSCGSPP